MIFKTDRPNLQVYTKGNFEPLQFVGDEFETTNAKEIKVLESIEGVRTIEKYVEEVEEESAKVSRVAIMPDTIKIEDESLNDPFIDEEVITDEQSSQL